MYSHQRHNYLLIAKAIEYFSKNIREKPDYEKLTTILKLSSPDLQRVLDEWAGTTLEVFIEFINLLQTKRLLYKQSSTLFDSTMKNSGPALSIIHDHFISINEMIPAEYKNGGQNLQINYVFSESPFGDLVIASTPKGVCYLAFYSDELIALEKLKQYFPKAAYHHKTDYLQQDALRLFENNIDKLPNIKLHLKGSRFQLTVWKALLKIPMGDLCSYKTIAQLTENPNASRAVGTAIGNNPVAFLIPCHRVVQSTGEIGGYMWGSNLKSVIIGWEYLRMNC